MDPFALHLELRNALTLADELSRHEHAAGKDELAAHLAALRTTLDELERDVGRTHDDPIIAPSSLVDSLERAAFFLRSERDEVPFLLRGRLMALVASTERIALALRDPHASIASKPLANLLPLARVVSQRSRTTLGWAALAACMTTALFARTRGAKLASLVLGVTAAGATLTADRRLGRDRYSTIEMRESFDLATGAFGLLAPVTLGYARRDPVSAGIHAVTGLALLVTSLVTDYRSGAGHTSPVRGRRSRSRRKVSAIETPAHASRPKQARGPRPLEGFSSAETDWPDGPGGWPSQRE